MTTALIRLLRPSDWVKNVFVLVPVLFWLPGEGRAVLEGALHPQGLSGESKLWTLALAVACTFAAFCCLASGFYAINDVMDASQDRRHPVKRLRPVASGAIAPRQAVFVGTLAIVIGLLLAAAAGNDVLLIAAAYAALQIAYNLALKRARPVDVGVLALGFCARAIAGAMAIEVRLSIWLILCVFFLTLFLGFVKRTCDLVSADHSGAKDWVQSAGYGDRRELDWLTGIAACSTVLMYLMYTLSSHAQTIFGVRGLGLALLTPLVLLVVFRFWKRANEGKSDSPLTALCEDMSVRSGIAAFVLGTLAILYVAAVEEWLSRAFVV